jgi:hypothetical protein
MESHRRALPPGINDGLARWPATQHTWQITDQAQRRNQEQEVLDHLEGLNRPPKSADERQWLGEELWVHMANSFSELLTPPGRQVFRDVLQTPGPIENNLHRSMLQRFDRYVIKDQLLYWGWRLFLSSQGLAMLARLEMHDSELLNELGQVLTRRSRWLQNQTGGRLPIDAEKKRKYSSKLTPDLQTLFPRVLRYYNSATRTPSSQEVIAFIRAEVTSRPLDYPCLSANLQGVLEFAHTLQDRFITIIRTPRGAAQFVNELLAKTHGYSPKTLKDLR